MSGAHGPGRRRGGPRAPSEVRAGATLLDRLGPLSDAARRRRLGDLPGLSARVRSAVAELGLTTVESLLHLPVAGLLERPNFGVGSLENLLDEIRRTDGASAAPEQGERARRPTQSSIPRLVGLLPRAALELALDDLEGLAPRTRRALRNGGYARLGDLARVTSARLRRTRGLGATSLADLEQGLRRLGLALAAGKTCAGGTRELLREVLLQQTFLQLVDARMAATGDVRSVGVLTRLHALPEPETLAAIGQDLGITRERVRQLKVRAQQALAGNGRLVALLDERIAAVRAARQAPLTWVELERADAWFEGVARREAWATAILQALGARHRVLPDARPAIVTLASAGSLGTLARECLRDLERRPDDFDRRTAAEAFLRERDLAELLEPILERTATAVRRGGRVWENPGRPRRVSWILEDAERPLHVLELLERLRATGGAHSERAVRSALEHVRMVCTGPSTWTHPARLERWNDLLPQVRRDVPALFEEDAGRQWSASELLEALRARRLAWASRIEALHVFVHLLRQVEALEELGRGIWGLRGRHAGRLPVHALAVRILDEAGQPLESRELLERVRALRGIGPTLTLRWPLVHLGEGRVGLAERDLGWSEAEYRHLSSAVLGELGSGAGRLSAERLEELRRDASPSLCRTPLWVLAAALVQPDNGLRLDGDGQGLRRGDVPRQGRTRAMRSGLPTAPTRHAGLRRLTATGFLTWLDRVGGGLESQELLERLQADLRVRLPAPALEGMLRAAGWERRGQGWHPAE